MFLYKSAVAGSSRESTVTYICSSFCMIVGAVILASFVVACAKKSQAEEDARQPLLEEREARREEREDSRDCRNKEWEDSREQQKTRGGQVCMSKTISRPVTAQTRRKGSSMILQNYSKTPINIARCGNCLAMSTDCYITCMRKKFI